MNEYISKKKLKQEINDDCSRITTKSSYYDGMKQGLHELLNGIDDGRFNEPPSSLELAIKALEWYADDKNQRNQRMYAGYESEVMKDAGKLAVSTLDQIRRGV